MKKFVLGIAGYIGSGKTTAGRYFAELGARFIDADEVVDELYVKGADGYRKILSFFGEEYLKKNAELNRRKLAQTVFGDPKKLRILQDLIHPLVTSRIQQLIDREGRQFYVLEATYFEKKHLKALIDALLWIECPKDELFRRLQGERGMEKPLFEKIFRIQVQPPNPDFVVVNNGSLEEFSLQLKKVMESLMKR